jgi:hypothetical protein
MHVLLWALMSTTSLVLALQLNDFLTGQFALVLASL